jgi:hypothetical protein
MQSLLQVPVFFRATVAALLTAAACYPRLAMWPERPSSVWELEFILLTCTGVLWGFVFAWHQEYSGRPVLTFKLRRNDVLTALGAGVGIALLMYLVFDPVLRVQAPKEYPTTVALWAAMSLFGCALQPLFFLFAPMALCLRLTQSRRASMVMTILFVLFLVALKVRENQVSLPPVMAAAFAITRMLAAFLALHFYLRGGLLLPLCFGIPIQWRLLIDISSATQNQ